MIGSVLFYWLYPLARYLLSGRSSEITKPGISRSCITGKQACEGPDVPPSSSMKGEKPEYAQEDQGYQRTTINGEQPITGLHGKLEMAEKSVGTGKEMLLDHWDLPLRRMQAKTHLHHQVFDLNLNEVKPAQTSSSAQHPDALMEDTSTRVITEGRTAPVESLTPAGLEEPEVPEVQAPFPIRECWDEYTENMLDRTEKCVLDLRSLLSDVQNHSADERQEETEPEESWGPQTCWHIPTGPGLADVAHCPLLEFPSMSYYPPCQHTQPLEVVWRVWEEVNAGHKTAVDPVQCASFDFSVMSYNILSQDLLEAHQELYSHCPLEGLDWSNRYPLLQQEILKWLPDIMCLQEVQENHYKEELHPFLAEIGYKCVYKRRTGTKTDGCATCYRGDRFSEVSATSLEYFRPESELLDRDNVGIALLLQPVLPSGSSEGPIKAPSCICVANTHLLFNPRRGDVKLAQLAIMLAEIHALVKASKSRGQRCNAILCGDFNAVPRMPLYQLITSGQLHYHGLPAWMVSGVEDLSYKANPYTLYAPLWHSSLGVTGMCQYTPSQDECEHHNNKDGKLQYSHAFLLQLRLCQAACVRPADLIFIPDVTDNTPVNSEMNFPHAPSMGPTICHGLGLSSVYQHVLPGLGQPEVTTLHSEAGATVDYIFYTPRRDPPSGDPKGFGSLLGGSLELTGYLSLLSEADLWSMAGLPNQHFPSDHLSLLARFKAW
ncbi:protein angel homolog 1 [Gadus morhua]|uniref:protein angel homolog 1 n=2 Tax=Gadus morhua TaxID=8049 RepID=UPI0011B58C6E|nr:protein angel homolog 1-like [Gadus morhua]